MLDSQCILNFKVLRGIYFVRKCKNIIQKYDVLFRAQNVELHPHIYFNKKREKWLSKPGKVLKAVITIL